MTTWLSDMAAGLGLLLFIGAAFILANVAPAILGAP
jgi:hypothetical protein